MCEVKRIKMESCHTNFVITTPIRNLQKSDMWS